MDTKEEIGSTFDWIKNAWGIEDNMRVTSAPNTALPTITISNSTGTNTTGDFYYKNIAGTNTVGQLSVGTGTYWTDSTSIQWGHPGSIAPANVAPSAQLTLTGDNADITFNGKSLRKTIEALEERLNWMEPNKELEKEWDNLKKLGDQYRAMEQECREKSEMWKKLQTVKSKK